MVVRVLALLESSSLFLNASIINSNSSSFYPLKFPVLRGLFSPSVVPPRPFIYEAAYCSLLFFFLVLFFFAFLPYFLFVFDDSINSSSLSVSILYSFYVSSLDSDDWSISGSSIFFCYLYWIDSPQLAPRVILWYAHLLSIIGSVATPIVAAIVPARILPVVMAVLPHTLLAARDLLLLLLLVLLLLIRVPSHVYIGR